MKIFIIQFVLFCLAKFFYTILAFNSSDEVFSCKSCGHEIAFFKDIIYKKSDYSLKSWNESLTNNDNFDTHFNKPRNQSLKPDLQFNSFYTVQVVENPHKVSFKLITLKHANLKLLNDTKSLQDTWFSNFKWTIGLCPSCLFHLGWHFESIIGEESFFGLILDKVIKKSDADSLILEPKLKLY